MFPPILIWVAQVEGVGIALSQRFGVAHYGELRLRADPPFPGLPRQIGFSAHESIDESHSFDELTKSL